MQSEMPHLALTGFLKMCEQIIDLRLLLSRQAGATICSTICDLLVNFIGKWRNHLTQPRLYALTCALYALQHIGYKLLLVQRCAERHCTICGSCGKYSSPFLLDLAGR